MGIAMGESEGVGIRLRRMRAIKVFKVSQGWGVGWGEVGGVWGSGHGAMVDEQAIKLLGQHWSQDKIN